MDPLRLVFCGSGGFAVPSLEAIAPGPHKLLAVITQPSRPSGRGGQLKATRVGQRAAQLGVAVIETADINSEQTLADMKALAPEVIVVVDFGQLIRAAARAAASRSIFNLHGSLLPELRGAAPVNWAIIRGYEQTGVTTFEVVAAMDAGPVYLKLPTAIGPDETAEQLRARLAQLGCRAVAQTIEMIAEGRAKPVEQDHNMASGAPKLSKADGLIDWSAPAEDIRNLIRGCWPWPAAHTTLIHPDGRSRDVAIAAAKAESGPAGEPGQAGEAGAVLPDGAVATGSGRVRIEQIKPAGGRLMSWQDFLNGYRVGAGDRFVSRRE